MWENTVASVCLLECFKLLQKKGDPQKGGGLLNLLDSHCNMSPAMCITQSSPVSKTEVAMTCHAFATAEHAVNAGWHTAQ